MVILEESTTDNSTGTTETDSVSNDHDPADDPADDQDGSIWDRMVDVAEQAATLMKPFTTLLTAIVQAATVATLVRQ